MVTKESILKILSEVNDPELGMNIVDIGLIYEVKVNKKEKGSNQKVEITMTFTTPACPEIPMILEDMKTRLDKMPGTDVDITVVFDPPWTPDMMSERAKIQTGMI